MQHVSVLERDNTDVAGEPVMGLAKVGDVVRYHDIANQNGPAYRVIEVPERHPLGWMTNYRLVGDDGSETTSDLRQSGWSFVSVREALR